MAEPLPLYVLVGGRSERFGQAKATYPVDGIPWAMHVASRLASDPASVAVVGKAAPAGLHGVRFVADQDGVEGPLAGVLAAVGDRLARVGPGCFVIASCDLVRPEAAWLDPLVASHDAETDLEIAAYRADDLWQPFPMVVHTRWQERLAAYVEAGERSFQKVLTSSRSQAVPWTESLSAGPPQANTPEELRTLLGE